MAALRAQPVFSGVIHGTSLTTVYTVPTGYRLILKFVTVQEVSGSSCVAQLRTGGAGTIFTWSLLAYSAAGSRDVGNFWIVLDQGDTVGFVRTTSGDITVTASGSLHAI